MPNFPIKYTFYVSGIVDTCGVRAVCWRLLLNYLPPNRETWPSFLQQQREIYKQFVNEMIVKPGRQQYDSKVADVTLEDHVKLTSISLYCSFYINLFYLY